MLKILLYALSTALIAGPVAVWADLVSLGCAYQTGSSGCGVRMMDFWDADFLLLAAVPWVLGAVCLLLAVKGR